MTMCTRANEKTRQLAIQLKKTISKCILCKSVSVMIAGPHVRLE